MKCPYCTGGMISGGDNYGRHECPDCEGSGEIDDDADLNYWLAPEDPEEFDEDIDNQNEE